MSNQKRDSEQCFHRDLPGNNCEDLERKYGCTGICPLYEDSEMEAEDKRYKEHSIRGFNMRNGFKPKKAMWRR
jgi:hypothetical protein